MYDRCAAEGVGEFACTARLLNDAPGLDLTSAADGVSVNAMSGPPNDVVPLPPPPSSAVDLMATVARASIASALSEWKTTAGGSSAVVQTRLLIQRIAQLSG